MSGATPIQPKRPNVKERFVLERYAMNPTTSKDWELYWQRYEAVDYVNYTSQLLTSLQQNIPLDRANVLEIGSGTGGNASKLAELGARVTTLDFAPTALERTRLTGQNAGVELSMVQADARYLPFASGTFDLVYHQGFLEHFTDPSIFLQEQRRILNNTGHLLIDVPQLFNWYTVHKYRLIRADRWPYGGWERQFSLRELTALLRSTGFRPIDAYGRGYFPRPFEMVRNLSRIEQKLFKPSGSPSRLWRVYDAGWQWFEQSWLGCNTLQCVGVLAEKRAE